MRPAYQQRVIDEANELLERRRKLRRFVASPTMTTVPEAEQERLLRQLKAMDDYAMALMERIQAFPLPATGEPA